MKRKAILAFVLCLALAGCGTKQDAVYVQSVERLASAGGIAPGDRFLGLVVSEHTAEITRDSEKTIQELMVKEGDDVKKGQALFSYDTEELQLSLDKKNLEAAQLQSTIESSQEKIRTLERERQSVTGTARLQYTVEIQSAQVDMKEAELKLKTKQDEVKKAEELLNNSTVTSPITGRVQKINESATTDDSGKPAAYIVIQQSGSYRVKGVLGELQRGSLREGDRVKRDAHGMGRFVLAEPEESETGREISINEVDIDNFIRAKGAIFSAIETLLNSVDMTVDMIDRVYVAGGIGSGINMKNAVNIGMFPDVDIEKFHYIGNSSLTGAYAMVMSNEAEAKCAEVAANMTYLELSTYPGYMDSFVAACFLPHTDRSLFPHSIQER